MDLLVRLDRSARDPLHVQLERELRDGVRSGRLAAGARLPATRALAAELRVARGVVVEAYAQLVAEGYLESRTGAGTFVADAPTAAVPTEAAAAPAAEPAWRFEFHPGHPDLSAFPRTAWMGAVRAALREVPDAQLGYVDPRGVPALRRELATHVGRSRGVLADPERVLVCGGLSQGLALVCRALRDRGARRVGLEDPGFFVHRGVVTAAGLEPVGVAVDEDGLRTQDLASLELDAVVVTPAHQQPTGVVLSPGRRAALLRWAEHRDAFVFEDDYDAEFRYDREPVGTLQGLAPERVVYAGSASKTLAPALRLGWLVLPAALAGAVQGAKALDDMGSPALDQLALAGFIARGELDRHLRRLRPRYRGRRDALVSALARHIPDARPRGVAAGLHVLVEFPDDVDEGRLVEEALRRRVWVQGNALGRFDPAAGPAGLVLGYASLTEEAIARGVRELAAATRAARRPPAAGTRRAPGRAATS